MAVRPQGETPHRYGLTITCEAPAGTDSVTPVEIGDIFKLSRTTAYKLVAAVDGDTMLATGGAGSEVLVVAMERSTDVKPIAVRVLGKFSHIKTLFYNGTAPTIGQSLIASSARKVKAVAYNGQNFACFVDTVKATVEVLG